MMERSWHLMAEGVLSSLGSLCAESGQNPGPEACPPNMSLLQSWDAGLHHMENHVGLLECKQEQGHYYYTTRSY